MCKRPYSMQTSGGGWAGMAKNVALLILPHCGLFTKGDPVDVT